MIKISKAHLLIPIIHSNLEKGAIEADKLAENQAREERSDMMPDVWGQYGDGHGVQEKGDGKNKLRMTCPTVTRKD